MVESESMDVGEYSFRYVLGVGQEKHKVTHLTMH